MKITPFWSLLLIGFISSFISTFSQCPVASSDQTLACGQSITLTAGTLAVNYMVSTAATTTVLTPATVTTVTGLTDDNSAGPFNLGFTYNHYGTNYTTFYIGSNGYITFGAGNTAWTSGTIPNSGTPNNMIAGALTDLNPTCGGTTVTYGTVGVAPNRRMVISFNNIRRLGCAAPAISFQIVLNEDHSFDIIYLSVPAGFGIATGGTENSTGSLGVGVPGFNNQAFPTVTTPTLYHFTPVSPTFLGWTVNGQTVSTTVNYAISPNTTTTYVANWNLGGTQTCQDPVLITVNTGITGDQQVNLCSGATQALSVTSTCYDIAEGSAIAIGATFNQGSTTTTSPTYRRPQGWTPCEEHTNTNFYYHVFQFSVSTAGNYTLNNCSPSVDAHAALYQNTFDPTNPCGNSNFIVANDDGSALSCGSDPQLQATLQPGITYYIVTTTWSSGTVIPTFSWTYTAGPTGAVLLTQTATATPPNWFTSATATSPIHSGTSMNPFTTTGSGVNMSTTQGNFNYYVSCPSTPQCRYQVSLNIAPLQPVQDVTICQGDNAILTSLNNCTPTLTTIAPGTTFNSGSLTATSPRWGRNTGGTACNGTTTPSQYYDVFTFQVTTAGYYTFDMCSTVDAHASLYQNAFNAANPCDIPTNFIVANDDGNGSNCSLDPRLTANLVPGVTYFLVSTTLSNNTTTTYSWTYSTTTTNGRVMSQIGAAGSLQWHSDLRGGTLLATADSYNPFALTPYPTGTSPSNYTYYVSCSNNTECRTPINLTINPSPQAPTSITGGGTVCYGTTTQLSVNGGSLPANGQWTWYEGSCNSTPIGTGNTINVTPNGTTSYFVNATGGQCGSGNCLSTTINLPTPGNQLGNNNETATCIVNQNGYVHFYHSSGRLIASINSFGQNLGTVSATVYTGNPIDMDACDNPTYMTTAMGRHWVVTPQFQPATPIDVVLPFYDTELSTLIPAANANLSPWDDLLGINDLLLSKYSGPLNVDEFAWNNCPDTGGNGGTTLHNQVANGQMNTLQSNIVANSLYTRHSIPGFSELWLHGSSTLTPLGATVMQLEAQCEGEKTSIRWSSPSSHSCDYYLVDRSQNGLDWETVHETNCIANTSVEVSRYKWTDLQSNDYSYYRLTEVNTQGTHNLIGVITQSCQQTANQIQLYPNPTTGIYHILIPSFGNDENAIIEIMDLHGKTIEYINHPIVKGSNVKTFDASEWPNGTYLIRVHSQSTSYPLQKLVVQQ